MTAASDIDEVTALSDAYEAALRRDDIEAMNGAFWNDPHVLRFGIADMQYGYDEVLAWRAAATPVDPARTMLSRHVVALADGVVAVDIMFSDTDSNRLGRQSQTWVRLEDGWRITRAHVSLIPR